MLLLCFLALKLLRFKLLLKVVALVVARLIVSHGDDTIKPTSAKFVHDVERGCLCEVARAP